MMVTSVDNSSQRGMPGKPSVTMALKTNATLIASVISVITAGKARANLARRGPRVCRGLRHETHEHRPRCAPAWHPLAESDAYGPHLLLLSSWVAFVGQQRSFGRVFWDGY